MISRYALLSSRIRQDLADLESVVQRARRYVAVASTSSDPEPYLDAAALHLHGFYAGLERLFETIARQLDHLVPSGPRWHPELLAQMALEVDGVRPAVLTREAVVEHMAAGEKSAGDTSPGTE